MGYDVSGAQDPRPLVQVLERPRLLAALDRGHALTIVSGPAGGGKTVLLAQWSRTQRKAGVAVARVALAETPANEQLVLREVFAQLLALDLIREKESATALLRGFDSLRDRDELVRRAFEDLERPCVLLIDNAERADEQLLLERALTLLDGAPLLRIVIATRRSTTTHALRLLASADVGVIGPAQLLFTPDEAREVIEGVSGQPMPPESSLGAGMLPLSARLLGLAHATRSTDHVDFSTAEREQVADALMSSLISTSVSPELREFLLATAVPSAVTLEIASRLGWAEDAHEHLDRAELFGLGMWESGEDGPAFVYTPMLREAFLRVLDQRPFETTAALRRIVAVWAHEHGRPLESVSNALAAKDYHLASRLGRKSWFVLARSSPRALERLLQRESPSVFIRFPILAAIMALVLTQLGHRLRAFPYYQSAALSLHGRTVDDDLVERFWTLTVKSLAERFAGQFRKAQATADLVSQTFDVMSPQQREDCEGAAALLLSSCGLSYLFAGRIAEAQAVLQQGMAMRVADAVTFFENGVTLRIPDDDGGWYHCASTLAAVHALQGRLSDARRVLGEIDEVDPPVAWRVDLFGIMEQVARSLVAVGDLDLDLAQKCVDSVAHHLGSTELWPFIVYAQSRVALHEGRAADALFVVDHALERGANSTTSEYAMGRLQVARAAAQLALGNRTAAEKSLAALAASDPARRALEGLSAVLSGDVGRAFAESDALGTEHESGADRDWHSLSLLVAAVAALRLEKPAVGSAAVARATALLREESTCVPLDMLPRDDLMDLRAVGDGFTAAHLDDYFRRRPAGHDLFSPLPAVVSLTSRELAVMRTLAKTASTVAIAEALFVSPNTVKVQRRSVYRKLGVSTREQALIRAAELGLLSGGEADDEEL